METILFWDFDGTLSYPNRSFTSALHWALSRNGYPIAEKEAVEFSENAYSWKTPEIAYPDRTMELWWDTHFEKLRRFLQQNNIPGEDMGKILADYRQKLTDVSNYTLYADTVPTLTACTEKGCKNYLVTNNYPEITNKLEELNIARFFSGYIVSSHIGYEKPRKEFFDHAKVLAGSPQKAYMIGDNPIADIRGGKLAGFTTIAVHTCRNSQADYYCQQLSQIIDLLH